MLINPSRNGFLFFLGKRRRRKGCKKFIEDENFDVGFCLLFLPKTIKLAQPDSAEH